MDAGKILGEKEALAVRAFNALRATHKTPADAIYTVLVGWMPMQNLKEMTELLEGKANDERH